MRVSVVVCTYDPEMYEDFAEAAESVLDQSYGDVELVVVVDGDETVCERVRADFEDRPAVRVGCNDENVGLAESRNRGAELADGKVIAFMDDDAVAEENWVAELVAVYEERDALAVGGRMDPEWVAVEPEFLPEEFYWLVGVTHRGFADGPGEVRNTFGSNMSFRREVFERLHGFDRSFGMAGDRNLQAEETEFCARMAAEFDEGMYYTPDAVVRHKVFGYRTDPRWLLERAFWQGYSKRAMDVLLPDSGGEEAQFLRRLAGEFLPERLRTLHEHGWTGAKQLGWLLAFTGVVGLGYLYGFLEWR